MQAYNYAGILLEESLWSKVNVVYRNLSLTSYYVMRGDYRQS